MNLALRIVATLFFIASLAHARGASALCNGVPTDANLVVTNYLSFGTVYNNQDVGVSDEVELRQALVGGMIGAYRSTHGVSSLPPGTAVIASYKNGSSECMVVSPVGTPFLAAPIPGTQMTPTGGSTGGGSPGGSVGGTNDFSYKFGFTTYIWTCDDYYSSSFGTTVYTGTICMFRTA